MKTIKYIIIILYILGLCCIGTSCYFLGYIWEQCKWKENKMRVTKFKNCYCHTCEKSFHYLGIARHRRSHLDRGESCEITYTHGDRYIHIAEKTGSKK